MSLDTIWPKLLTVLRTNLVVPAPGAILKGISEGEPPGVPESPWGILSLSSFNRPDQEGSALEVTDWTFTLRLLHEWAPDQVNAEVVVASLIEPVSAVLRANLKLGDPTIARVRVLSGDSGFISINNIWFRSMDLSIGCREKVAVSSQYAPG